MLFFQKTKPLLIFVDSPTLCLIIILPSGSFSDYDPDNALGQIIYIYIYIYILYYIITYVLYISCFRGLYALYKPATR